MATINVTIPLGKLQDFSAPGNPVPNTGVIISATTSFAYTNPSVVQMRNLIGTNFSLKSFAVGSCVVTLTTQNASGVTFTDTINVTVPNPIPDATDSGLVAVGTPHD